MKYSNTVKPIVVRQSVHVHYSFDFSGHDAYVCAHATNSEKWDKNCRRRRWSAVTPPKGKNVCISTRSEKMCSPAHAADPRNNTLLYVVFATRVRSYTGRTHRRAGPEMKNNIIIDIMNRRRNTRWSPRFILIVKIDDFIYFYNYY